MAKVFSITKSASREKKAHGASKRRQISGGGAGVAVMAKSFSSNQSKRSLGYQRRNRDRGLMVSVQSLEEWRVLICCSDDSWYDLKSVRKCRAGEEEEEEAGGEQEACLPLPPACLPAAYLFLPLPAAHTE